MTQPVLTRNVNLPPPSPRHPTVTRVVSAPPLEGLPNDLLWMLNQPHPMVKGMRIVRIFDDDSGVVVYSVGTDGTPMRNRIPSFMVKLVEETMSVAVLIQELEEAESDDDDEDEEEEPEETSNGSGLEPDDQPALDPPTTA